MSFISTLIMILVLSPVSPVAEEALYARYPALSPDGNTVAFTYMGDIWTVAVDGGRAQRLTVHEAEDIRPQFSPDGAWILFSSRRFDNFDVFVIPSAGGQPRQLTFNTAHDYGTGWFPQSDSVVFTSRREGWDDIFKVCLAGGTPIKLTGYYYEKEYNGRISSDGSRLVYNNGSGLSRWWRRDLRASGNADIFIQDRTRREFTSKRLTDYVNHDVWPVLNEAASEVYFVSCRGDWAQIWKVADTGGTATVMTDFEGDGVQWLNSNPQGTLLVFEQGFHIWTMDPAEGTPRKIPIEIRSDERMNPREVKTFDGKVEWFSLSPDEKKIAVIVHGEIFVVPAEEPEEGIRITSTQAREQNPVWGADSRTIYYVSDRDGDYDVFAADAVSGEERRLTDTDKNERRPLVSPDGRYLVYYRDLDQIIRMDLESNAETVWVEGPFTDLAIEPTIEYDWSPDSRWLAFTMAGPTYQTDIYVVDLDGNVHNLSQFAGWTHRPRFSQDGRKVYFTSWIHDRDDTYEIDLVPEPVEFFEAVFDSLFVEKEKDSKTKDDDSGTLENNVPEVKIDFENIERRRHRAYRLAASSYSPVLTPDGSAYLFAASLLGKTQLWAVNTEDEPDLRQVTKSADNVSFPIVTTDSKTVYYLDGGKVKSISVEGKDAETLAFKSTLDIDRADLSRQKLHESWQLLNSYFYDTTFHGTDWSAVLQKYEPVVEHVRTEEELANLLKELMGELRASHLGVYPDLSNPSKAMRTGATGIDLNYTELETTGNYRIANVVTDSPADRAGISAGGYITAINGRTITADSNLFRMLAGTEGNRVVLSMADKPGGEDKSFTIKPVSSISDQIYNDWVKGRRDLVDSLSGGRLAYLHIPRMYNDRLDIFKEQLVSVAEGKEGLLIDVRNNGGGSIAVHLLGILVKSPYFLRAFRQFPITSENKYRSDAVEKPMALLINNYAASNSEIFAEGFRKLGLGKIIGVPTSAAVIGTGSYRLIDGTRIRRPSTGAFTTEMEDTELVPRQPDIFVENLPDDFINGRDPQLVRAVETLLEELQ